MAGISAKVISGWWLVGSGWRKKLTQSFVIPDKQRGSAKLRDPESSLLLLDPKY
jgi:hypothetical protein